MRYLIILLFVLGACSSNKSSQVATEESSCKVSISGEKYLDNTQYNEISISLGKCKQCLTSEIEYAVNDSLLFQPIKLNYEGKSVKVELPPTSPGIQGVYVRATCISNEIHSFYYNVGISQ